MKAYLQKLGKSLMLPVAVLPAAGILIGLAMLIDPSLGNPVVNFFYQGGLAVIGNLAILFAVGIALGMSRDKDGAAALSGLVAYLVVVNVLAPDSLAGIMGVDVSAIDVSFGKIDGNAFIGIISGLVAAAMYNRFAKVQLPQALAFFSGKRLAPIMSAVSMLVVAVILMFVWPIVYAMLVGFGTGISSLGAIGAGIFGFFNRLLIPIGLHHALNAVFWFDTIGINDIGNFWSSTGQQGIVGMYQAGFFPMMMFGLPAGAFAIYRCADPKKRKVVGSLMLAGALASFLTGITEPLEFSFMFAAPMLYLVHAVLTGLSLGIAALFHWTAGFSFSAGFVDFIASFRVPIANQPYMLIVLGLVMAVLYYFSFTFFIKNFNLATPGRGADADEADVQMEMSVGESKFFAKAKIIFEGLGGWDNIRSIDYCATRLRVEINNMKKVDQDKIKTAGIAGIKVIDDHNIQVIVGTEVQFVADEIKAIPK